MRPIIVTVAKWLVPILIGLTVTFQAMGQSLLVPDSAIDLHPGTVISTPDASATMTLTVDSILLPTAQLHQIRLEFEAYRRDLSKCEADKLDIMSRIEAIDQFQRSIEEINDHLCEDEIKAVYDQLAKDQDLLHSWWYRWWPVVVFVPLGVAAGFAAGYGVAQLSHVL